HEIAALRAPGVDHFSRALSGGNTIGPVEVPAATAGGFSLVHASGKSASRAGDDHGANFRISFDFIEGSMQFLDQIPADGIHCFGTIESDQDAASLLLVNYLFVFGHRRSFYVIFSSVFVKCLDKTAGFGFANDALVHRTALGRHLWPWAPLWRRNPKSSLPF